MDRTVLARSSSVRFRPAIHSACLIISGVTVPAWDAWAARARRKVALPIPRPARPFKTVRRLGRRALRLRASPIYVLPLVDQLRNNRKSIIVGSWLKYFRVGRLPVIMR